MTREPTYQILGFIDALEDSPSGRAGVGIPAIIFLTTGDTKISAGVRGDAFFKGVAIWQSIACETIGPGGNNLRMSEAVVTNPEVYVIQVTVPGPIGPGAAGRLRPRQ